MLCAFARFRHQATMLDMIEWNPMKIVPERLQIDSSLMTTWSFAIESTSKAQGSIFYETGAYVQSGSI
jgi:hypothetical protein